MSIIERALAKAKHEDRAAVEDAGRLIDALGVSVPVGVPETFRAPVPDPLGDLVLELSEYNTELEEVKN